MLQIPRLQSKELLLLFHSYPCGRECMEHWLCVLIHWQHSWAGVEGKVKCTRKRAGTDYIICRRRGKQGPNWNWVTATVPCLLCGDQGYALPLIQGRVQWCQASLCFFLLLHSFIGDLEYMYRSGQISLQNYKNNSGTNSYCLHVFVICFIVQCLFFCLLLCVLAKHVLHCGALETMSAHARDSVVHK